MTDFIFTHSKSIRGGSRLFSFALPFYIGRVSLMFMMMMFIAIMGFVYLYSFNANATVGYELSRLEHERSKLLTVQEQNNIDLSSSQSLEHIRYSSLVRGMVRVTQVEYVGAEGVLAVNY